MKFKGQFLCIYVLLHFLQFIRIDGQCPTGGGLVAVEELSCDCQEGFYTLYSRQSQSSATFFAYVTTSQDNQLKIRFGREGNWNYRKSRIPGLRVNFMSDSQFNYLSTLNDPELDVQTDLKFTVFKDGFNPSTILIRYLDDLSIVSKLCLGVNQQRPFTSFQGGFRRPGQRPFPFQSSFTDFSAGGGFSNIGGGGFSGEPFKFRSANQRSNTNKSGKSTKQNAKSGGLFLEFDGRTRLLCNELGGDDKCGVCGLPNNRASTADFLLQSLILKSTQSYWFDLTGSFYYVYVLLKNCVGSPAVPQTPIGNAGPDGLSNTIERSCGISKIQDQFIRKRRSLGTFLQGNDSLDFSNAPVASAFGLFNSGTTIAMTTVFAVKGETEEEPLPPADPKATTLSLPETISADGISISSTISSSSITGTEIIGPPQTFTQGNDSKPFEGRIVHGVPSKRGAWPWQTSIRYKGIHICGGTLVSTLWVITASHCQFSRRNPADITLSFGTLFSSGVTDEFEQTRRAVRIIEHEQFNQGLKFNNDIALIKLNSPVRFNDYVSPICLPTSPFSPGSLCFVTGYGATKGTGVENILNEVAIPLLTPQQCSQPSWLGNLINSNMICAGGGEKDSCQGDSGGPLQCLDEAQGNLWVLTGVVSWGVDCGKINKPGVYTDVGRYIGWLKSKIQSN